MQVNSGSNFMSLVVIGIAVALIVTIVLWVAVIPEKKRAKLNKFFGFLSDVFNFRSLLTEKLLKFLYTLLTVVSIIVGFCMLFIKVFDEPLAGYGLLLMIAGPIALRLVFEAFMLGILLVKNVIEINNKLSYPEEHKCTCKETCEEVVEEVADEIVVEEPVAETE